MLLPHQRRPQWIAGVLLAWTAVGLFFFTQDLLRNLMFGDPTPWWHLLVSWLIGTYLSAALTPVMLWLGRRFPLERKRWARRVALHLMFSMMLAITHLVVDSAIVHSLGLFPAVMKTYAATFIILMVFGFHGNVTGYWIVLGIQAAFRYYNQYQERRQTALRLELQASELQSRLVQAQLSALKGQLQPHFLFNTLNAIMVLVRQEKGRQAEEMLARLSDLLRSVLEDVEAQEVPLRRELESLQLYLSIEEVRFQDRLRVEISVDPEVLNAAVPHLGLQPIVENAVRHGIGNRSAAGLIEISAARIDQSLRIQVRDDGPGLPSETPERVAEARGIGLANTRERLRQLYGEAASLTLANDPRGGAVATLILPYRVETGKDVSEVMEIHDFAYADPHVDRR
ncbi:MAG TPA: histidine kinase [Thermoanaerobaculia bacterium]|jgi:sensor histidine kinase YesM|nr:histidine kinase [Thermoanaerobaculia bacterium]